MKKIILSLFVTYFCTLTVIGKNKPNIIVIYTDDQGYGDMSALNSKAKFKTPHMDRLANEGITFTHGHSSHSVCTPSRYSLLTGRYPWRTAMKSGVLKADEACLIADGRMTLATLLRDNGYNTGMVGKWHLGWDIPGTTGERDWSKPVKDMPLDKGFEYFFGIPASMNYGVLAWFEGRFAKVPPVLFTKKKKNERHQDYRIKPIYEKIMPDVVGNKALKKVIEVAPDFVDNLCLTRFTDKAIEWIGTKSADAKNGKPFFLYLPYTSPHYPVCPLPEFHGKGNCGGYGEFLIETDYHIGRILNFLKQSGLDEDTLIFFSSDNGPAPSWDKRIKEFGHYSNFIFRGGKQEIYEGGHRVPFLVRWPGGIINPGRKYDNIVGQVDLLATFAELIGADLPDNAAEDSISFAPVLLDKSYKQDRKPLIQFAGDRFAVSDGKWKLILPGTKKNQNLELYDLENDPSETKNRVTEFPEKVKYLTKAGAEIIINGRTSDGAIQKNDTSYWDKISWLDEEVYNARQKEAN